jgi:hypothetical protein
LTYTFATCRQAHWRSERYHHRGGPSAISAGTVPRRPVW